MECSGEEVGGIERRETGIRIYHVRKIFSIQGKIKKTPCLQTHLKAFCMFFLIREITLGHLVTYTDAEGTHPPSSTGTLNEIPSCKAL